MEILQRQFRAPEVYGDYWFNSDPVVMAGLRGYTVLVDFWSYTSLPCLNTLPYLKEWHRRYEERGLVILGVHSPEFAFARDAVNVRRAIEKLGIKYAVVMDNDFIAWGAYRNMAWPTKYLVDKNGFIRYLHSGEGSYQNFEHSIQSLLNESGYQHDLPLVMDPVRESDRPGAICYKATSDILTGWQRGTIGNIEGYAPESTMHYEDPGFYIEGRIYLHGNWLNSRDFLKLEESEGTMGYLTLTYAAKEVYAVIKPEGEKNFQMFVQQDDAYLTRENAGEDIRFDEEGKSFVRVDEAKLFHLVRNKGYGEHKLRLSTRSNGFAMYSISFVSCAIPESVPNN